MKNITKLLLSVAVLLNGLAMLSGNEVVAQIVVTANSNAAKSEKSAEALVENSQVIIKVIGVKNFVSGESVFLKPEPGNKFAAVQVIVDNTNGTEDWEVIPSYFILKDSENNTYIQNYYFVRPTLNFGIIDNGEMAKGWVSFEIPADLDIKSLKLRYEDKSYTEKKYKSDWIFLSAVK